MTDPHGANLRGAVDLSSLVRKRNAPPAPEGANGQGTAQGALVREASEATFTELLELSRTVPVLVELYVGTPTASLAEVVKSLGGRFVLATVEANSNPQLVQAFQAAAAPTVVAVIGGRPLPLYEGELPAEQVRAVLQQVDEVAAQNGVTGRIQVSDVESGESDAGEPEEEPLPPLHQEAFDAISRGDFDAAIAAYGKALAQSPRDADASAGLAQVNLLKRLQGKDAGSVRVAAADDRGNVDAQLDVADLDVSGGHLEDAFSRLLELYPVLDDAGKDRVRRRLLDYFELVGGDDPRVVEARRALTSLLY